MHNNYKNYHRDSDYIKMSVTLRNIFLSRFKIISKYVNKGKVLEIGSSTGEFLQIFREHGFEVAGIEPSNSGEVAVKRGLKIFKGYFEDIKLKKDFYDLVILNHTLEHMQDPHSVVAKVNTILKKDGIIFIDVPNAGGIGSRLLGKFWPYRLPDEHVSQFDKKQLFSLLQGSGFKVIFWQSRSGVMEYANPFLEFRRRGFFKDIAILPYSLLATMFKMGDSITVIGRKHE